MLEFRLCTAVEDKGKMHFADSVKNAITIVDTSTFMHNWQFYTASFVIGKLGEKKASKIFIKEGKNRKIWLKDAQKGFFNLWAGDKDTIAVAIENDPDNYLDIDDNVMVRFGAISNDVRIYKSRNMGNSDEIFFDDKPWGVFKSEVLTLDSIFILCRNYGEYRVEVSVDTVKSTGKKIADTPKSSMTEVLHICRQNVVIADRNNKKITPDVPFRVKPSAPLRIITSKVFQKALDTIVKVNVVVKYDSTNNDHVRWYETRVTNRVVWAAEQEILSTDNNCEIVWNCRDSTQDRRLVLGGNYAIEISCETSKKRILRINKKILVDRPQFVSLGISYRDSPESNEERNWLRSLAGSGELYCDSIPFLTCGPADYGYPFLNDFNQGVEFSSRINGFDKKVMYSGTPINDILDTIEQTGAAFRIFGHHGIGPRNDGVVNGVWSFSNGKKLHANLENNLICIYDSLGRSCLNGKCIKKSVVLRDSLYLDDVLLAVAMICRTDTGDISTASVLINHGVDCVIGTKKKVLIIFSFFWNYYFWDFLNKNQNDQTYTINKAAFDAYGIALERLRGFYGFADIDDMVAAFGTNPTDNNRNHLDLYENTISIKDCNTVGKVSEQCFYPARYGETTR
jgi:hypothetical protein